MGAAEGGKLGLSVGFPAVTWGVLRLRRQAGGWPLPLGCITTPCDPHNSPTRSEVRLLAPCTRETGTWRYKALS